MAPRRFAALLMGLLALPAWAAQLPELRVEAAGEGSLIYLRNLERVPLVAWTVELVGYPGSSFTHTESNPQLAVAPATERSFRVGSKMVGAVPDYMKVTAALYADGGSAGDPTKVNRLIDTQRADLILHNGKIVTADAAFSIQQAVAIKGGRIAAVGGNQTVLARRGPNT